MKTSFVKALGLLAAAALAGQAGASGFEKSIMFGGKTAGTAGIGSPQTQGSEALYFNPAGLVSDKGGQDVSLNLSPSWPKFQAPVSANNASDNSKSQMILPFSLMYAKNVNEKMGFGAGVYTSAGAAAEYENIKIGTQPGSPEVKSELKVIEAALGVGYKVTDSLKLGLAYRIAMVDGDFGFLTPVSNTVVVNTTLHDVKATTYTGFKLGAQWKASENTHLAFTYRSNNPFSAKAKAKQTRNVGAGYTTIAAETEVRALATLPEAYTLGIKQVLSENWNFYGEYVYTLYSRIQNIQLEGKLGTTNNPSIQLAWRDQTNIRLAGEYLGAGMPIRFGYIWTSQVEDNQFAKPTLTAPGVGHTFTLGTGMNMGEAFSLNGGLEYTVVKGTGGASPASASTRLGDYKTTNYGLHLGLGYSF